MDQKKEKKRKKEEGKFSPQFLASVKAHNNNMALYEAIIAKGNETDDVKKAVAKGANLNSLFKDRLPLQWAIRSRKFNRFKMLAEINPEVGERANLNATVTVTKQSPAEPANPNAPESVAEKKIEMSLVHYAALKGYSEFVRYMVEHKVDTTQHDQQSRRLLPVHNAAASGDCETLAVLNNNQQALRALSGEGDYCIHIAVIQGKTDMIKYLLKLGAEVDSKNYHEQTPLHFAIKRTLKNIVVLLLERKASKTICDDQGRNAVLLAVATGNRDIVRLLLLPGEKCDAADFNGLGAMHIAAENNDVPMMQLIKRRDHLTWVAADNRGRVPIHVCAEKDALEAFNFIIEELRKELAETYSKRYAGEKLEKEVQEELRMILFNWQDKSGNSVVEYALRFRAKKVVARLVQLDIISARREVLSRGLMQELTEVGDVEWVSLLLSQGVSCVQLDAAGRTPIHIAIQLGFIPILELFRDRGKFDFKSQDEEGQLPIHWASAAGQQRVVEWLLANKGGSLADVDNHGRNCLFHAVRSNCSELIVHFVNVKKMSLATRCKKNFTVMHHAVFKSAQQSVLTLKALKFSLEALGEHGILPLHIACRTGSPEMVHFLLAHGAKKAAKSNFGRNAWFYAAGGCHEQEMFLTLEKYDIPLFGETDNSGMNPVHHAAISANLIAIQYFKSRGFSCVETDTSGETPLNKAIKQREKDLRVLGEKMKTPEFIQGGNAKLIDECKVLQARIEKNVEVIRFLENLTPGVINIAEQQDEADTKDSKKRESRGETEKDVAENERVVKSKTQAEYSDLSRKNDEGDSNNGPKM